MSTERVRTGRILLALAVATLLSLALCGQTTVPVPCPLPGSPYHSDSFGTTDSSWFMFSSRAVALPDQGMVVMGQRQAANGKGVRLTRTDALGKVVWDYSYMASPTAAGELPTALTHTASGDLLVAGMVSSYSNLWDPFLMKVDANGNLLWYKTYGCGRCVHISDVAEGVNGTIALVGMDYYYWTAGWGGNSIWNVGVDPARNAALALVTDGAGNVISGTPYAMDFQGSGRVWEFFTDVEPLSSGGFLISGQSGHNWDNIFAQLLVKVDDNGAQQWVHTYGYNMPSTTGWNSAFARCATQDSPTTALISGTVSDHEQYGTNYSYHDLCMSKIDLATGNVLWGWRHPGRSAQPWEARMVGGRLVAIGDVWDGWGGTQAGAALFRIDPVTGLVVDARTYDYGPVVSRGADLRSIDVFSNGDLALAGHTPRDGRAEPWYLHTDGQGTGVCASEPLVFEPAIPINWVDLGMAVNDPAVEGAAWSDSFQATAVDRTLEHTCGCVQPSEWCPAPSIASFTILQDVLCLTDSLRLSSNLPASTQCGGPAYTYGWSFFMNGTVANGQVVNGTPIGTWSGPTPPRIAVPPNATSMQARLQVLDCAGVSLCSAAGQATVGQPAITFSLGNDTTVCAAAYTVGPTTAVPGHRYSWYQAELADPWAIPQPHVPISTSVPLTITASGSYFLVDSMGTCAVMDSVRVVLAPIVPQGLNDVQACVGDTVTLDATWTPGSTYQWSAPLASTGAQVQVTASGTYVVIVTKNGCSGRDSALVDLRPAPMLGLPPSITLCLDGGPYLFTLPTYVDSIRWSSGPTTPTLIVDGPGTYGAIGWVAGCASDPDSMVVERVDCSCQLYLPNTFTPNGDGVNDAWGPLLACDLEDLTLMVFDRWGELLQTLTARDLRWDGNYGGSPCPIGVYPYKLRYTVRLPDATLERPQEQLGHVTIVR